MPTKCRWYFCRMLLRCGKTFERYPFREMPVGARHTVYVWVSTFQAACDEWGTGIPYRTGNEEVVFRVTAKDGKMGGNTESIRPIGHGGSAVFIF